ncbi:hypothetical protein Bbelb_024520 [Branchiostoma belcheri]|nr:hypothetical protein Bbelb_024520 [Branchiostoma belcheri]
MEPLIEAKRRALLSYKRCPSDQTLTALRTARNSAKRIQISAESGDLRGMYNGIKKALGPTVKKTAPLKSLSGVTEQLSIAIDSLPCGKAPGSGNIPPEAIKQGKPAALLQPQGISLLNIVGTVYARILLNRLKILADRVYPESQCGFRAKRSTTDMIFSLRQLEKKRREQGKPLYMLFIDFTKAFDLVSRKSLFELLKKIGCPPKLCSLVVSSHTNMKGTVMYDGSCSDPFTIKSGVNKDGVYLATWADGKLLNLARLRSKAKVRNVLLGRCSLQTTQWLLPRD